MLPKTFALFLDFIGLDTQELKVCPLVWRELVVPILEPFGFIPVMREYEH